MSETLRLGTRRSQLALWQANHVADRLRAAWPGLDVELVEIVTRGDQILDRPLSQVGGKGLFVNGIEERLVAGSIDLAVHSMKDLPSALAEGLVIAATPERADPRDALVYGAANAGEPDAPRSLALLPAGARVGTSSLRRTALARRLNPGIEIVPLRGNVPTRVASIEAGKCDAVLLAVAGLERLGRHEDITERLDPASFCPAATQGILAIETRADDNQTRERVAVLDHAETAVVAAAERAFLARLDGGCQVPMGAHATLMDEGATIQMHGVIGDPAGRPVYEARERGARADAAAVGTAVAEALLGLGAGAIIERLVAESGSG